MQAETTADSSKLNTAVLFIGNAGSGKSSLLSLLGGNFAAGTQFRSGYTKVLSETKIMMGDESVTLIDVPGLFEPDDSQTRRNAVELSKALKLTYKFKLFFILKASNSGLDNKEMLMMSRVSECVRQEGMTKVEFRVLINQVEDDHRRMYHEEVVKDNFRRLFSTSNIGRFSFDIDIGNVALLPYVRDKSQQDEIWNTLVREIQAQSAVRILVEKIDFSNEDLDLYSKALAPPKKPATIQPDGQYGIFGIGRIISNFIAPIQSPTGYRPADSSPGGVNSNMRHGGHSSQARQTVNNSNRASQSHNSLHSGGDGVLCIICGKGLLNRYYPPNPPASAPGIGTSNMSAAATSTDKHSTNPQSTIRRNSVIASIAFLKCSKCSNYFKLQLSEPPALASHAANPYAIQDTVNPSIDHRASTHIVNSHPSHSADQPPTANLVDFIDNGERPLQGNNTVSQQAVPGASTEYTVEALQVNNTEFQRAAAGGAMSQMRVNSEIPPRIDGTKEELPNDVYRLST
ncbi:hypothetical protein BGX27_003938 [Mortierella sp. AM989]|nr:hypothetical protein BGX27_003938 [Mortierella sp. AM989]